MKTWVNCKCIVVIEQQCNVAYWGVSAVVMKNCEPFVFGPALAILRRPTLITNKTIRLILHKHSVISTMANVGYLVVFRDKVFVSKLVVKPRNNASQILNDDTMWTIMCFNKPSHRKYSCHRFRSVSWSHHPDTWNLESHGEKGCQRNRSLKHKTTII